jgi:hypothetical protein
VARIGLASFRRAILLPGRLRLPSGGYLDGPCVVKDDHGEGRKDGEGENCKWYAEDQHDGGDTRDGQDANQQVDYAVHDEFLNVSNVARNALDEIAFLLLAMPVQRDALQVFKELLA